MKTPSKPANEIGRLRALRQHDLLDTLQDQTLDDVAALAGHICNAPIAMISLVDENRQWFKSNLGMPTSETSRDISFCAHAINGRDLFVVRDAADDERFLDNPLVTGDPRVRFYAGAPLVTADGYALGTLCVIDHVPRDLTPAQMEALRVLSRQVMAQFDLRRQTRELVESEARLMHVFTNCPVGVAIHRWSDRTFVDVNEAFTTLVGWRIEEIRGRTTQQVGMLTDEASMPIRSRLGADRELRDAELTLRTRDGETKHVIMGSVITDLFMEPQTITTFVDITERKRAEAAASRLAAIVESSDDAIIGKDLSGIITSWNGGATKLFGYTPAEMVGRNITHLIPEDRHDEENDILTQLRADRQVHHFETVRRKKDGSLVDVSVTASPIKDAAGNLVGASKVARDISQRKHAEGILREREEQLRLYAEHSPAAIAMFDRDMKYLVVSQRWRETFRLGEKPLVGRDHYEVFPEIPKKWRDVNERTLRGAVERCDEEIFPRYDGTVDWIRWETRPWHRADGSIGGMIIFVENITERKLTGAALRASEERMRFALENAEIGIWDIDYTTGVVKWSHMLEAQYGLEPGAFRGTMDAVLEGIHPEDRAVVQQTLRDAAISGEDFTTSSRAVWPSGEVRWLNGAGRIQRDEHGAPVRGVGISMDVTERRRLEEQYQQSQKMEAIGRLAGGVAHDFNNVLTVILGYCELLMRDFDHDDVRRSDVAEIQRAGTRASRLTRQLLAFSRKQIIEPRLLEMNQIAVDLEVMLGRLIGEDVEIALELAPDLAHVMADRGQIEQILMNLAVNARDAMPKGGTLTIATANVTLDEHYAKMHPTVEAGDYVALVISDTGTGMSEEVKERIFEPFFTTKEVGRGTGLGMATVYGIVAQSGGSIDIESEIGRGTTFRIYLPVTNADELVPELPATVPRSRSATQTVLLVEDEHELRELSRKLLERLGYTVVVAANAEEAMHQFHQNADIDVVLTDVVMPGESGPELTRQLTELRPGLKVVFMSGYTDEAIVHHGVLKPGIVFLNKPFTLETLEEKIRQVLEQ